MWQDHALFALCCVSMRIVSLVAMLYLVGLGLCVSLPSDAMVLVQSSRLYTIASANSQRDPTGRISVQSGLRYVCDIVGTYTLRLLFSMPELNEWSLVG